METPTTPSNPGWRQARQVRLLYFVFAVVIAAAFAAVAVTLAMRGGGSAVALPTAPGPAAVSEAQLRKLAAQTDHPIYWAGAKSGVYELTRVGGRVYVRYLPSTEKVGDRTANYLTVGTYADKSAFRSIVRAAHRPGAVSLKLADNGLLVFNASAPKSIYFGYPNARYQVEVYDPSPEQARALVLSGAIKPIR
jgi:hypothetical protein